MRLWAGIGAALGCLGVAAGALGAHGLKARLEPEMLSLFEIGVRYQVYHSVALVLVGLTCTLPGLRQGLATLAGISFSAGIFLFSGSLYALSLTSLRVLGAFTPLGGVAFLVGWVALSLIFLLRRSDETSE